MNFLSFRLVRTFILAAAIFCTVFPGAAAAEPAADEMTMTLEENIAFPPVPAKRAEPVRRTMTELLNRFKSKKFSAQTLRNGEVVKITIPVSDVFRSNTIEISPEGKKTLHEFVKFASHTDQFKILVAVHTDDTGDEQYRDNLSADRANAIDEYFFNETGKETNLIPYGIGHDQPLKADTSTANRAANRRIEIYFVPTEAYVKYLNQ